MRKADHLKQKKTKIIIKKAKDILSFNIKTKNN